MTTSFDECSYFESEEEYEKKSITKKRSKDQRKNSYSEIEDYSKKSISTRFLDEVKENLENAISDLKIPFNVNDYFPEMTDKKIKKELQIKDIIIVKDEVFTVEDIEITMQRVKEIETQLDEYAKKYSNERKKTELFHKEIKSEIDKLITFLEDYLKQKQCDPRIFLDEYAYDETIVSWQTNLMIAKSRTPDVYMLAKS
ncbi:6418_t:CDS:1 [Ambispora gerdemannii]|uniref:6418_t:CDS:1 n=1 Tax=Ambispora gerdemannii TaxID=144530 RepID=A0A9N9B2E9_9GLOM|nr:6418_t:CDS:1 [Ambispora gerdemannii]